MQRILATAFLLSLVPAAVMAEGTMPQMDFHNPLTLSQVEWMVVILLLLYGVLAGWALPGMGKVLAVRADVIARDLAAAQAAKALADQAVRTLKAEMNAARAQASRFASARSLVCLAGTCLMGDVIGPNCNRSIRPESRRETASHSSWCRWCGLSDMLP
ncbi:MAG: hypothetical protein POH28_04440, partial [Acidocella sp.]|nr:hypothetical protein [Acidocella sp.]